MAITSYDPQHGDPYWDYAPQELLTGYYDQQKPAPQSIDIMPLALILVSVLIVAGLLWQRYGPIGSVAVGNNGISAETNQPPPPIIVDSPGQRVGPQAIPNNPPVIQIDPSTQPLNPPASPGNPGSPLPGGNGAFIAPYDNYIITQGLHGFSYGHAAIDIAAGKGATIKSSITGVVTERYTDPSGNPTLVIENDTYRVTLLHGDYIVNVGDQVQIGQVIGQESNHGNTTDMAGNSCRNRDCGYHSHLNVFDKRLGQNVDPQQLWQ